MPTRGTRSADPNRCAADRSRSNVHRRGGVSGNAPNAARGRTSTSRSHHFAGRGGKHRAVEPGQRANGDHLYPTAGAGDPRPDERDAQPDANHTAGDQNTSHRPRLRSRITLPYVVSDARAEYFDGDKHARAVGDPHSVTARAGHAQTGEWLPASIVGAGVNARPSGRLPFPYALGVDRDRDTEPHGRDLTVRVRYGGGVGSSGGDPGESTADAVAAGADKGAPVLEIARPVPGLSSTTDTGMTPA